MSLPQSPLHAFYIKLEVCEAGLDFSIAARRTLMAVIAVGGVAGLIQGSPASPSSSHTQLWYLILTKAMKLALYNIAYYDSVILS